MKDWVNFITAVIQLVTALAILQVHNASRNKKKKGTKRRGRRRR
ncbi:hypothetical protein ACIFQM_11295 [Paenibacillus sp. NRS-1782]